MSLKKALLAATVLAMPLAAQAQPVTGVYVGAGAGINFLQNSDADLKGGAAAGATTLGGFGSSNGTLKFDPGYVGVLAVGYGFGNGVRAELEGNFRHNSLDETSGFGGSDLSRRRGNAVSYGAMANGYYDFYNLGLPMGITPYVGLGIGYVATNYDNVRMRDSTGGVLRLNGPDGQFAYQAIAGASMPVSAVPGLSLTAEYRFLGTLSPEINATYYDSTGGRSHGKAEVDNNNHSILVGLRYAFNTPAPAVAPAPAPAPVVTPAPAPARTYLVFFDFDSATLTDRARQITSEAAQNSKRVAVTKIEVSGHADRSGSPQYNQALSQRRAEAVAAELGRLGVKREEIVVQAFGESRPLVPTADGVREPQNRRVELVLR